MLLVEEIFNNINIDKLTYDIAKEFENRNIFPLTYFHRYLDETCSTSLHKECKELQAIMVNIISDKNTYEKLTLLGKDNPWLANALWFGNTDAEPAYVRIAIHICAYLIQSKFSDIDDYVESINDNSLCRTLGIFVDDNGLVDMKDIRFSLNNHGIIFDGSILIYPHQFFRRFYSSNFVNMPRLLRKAHNNGAHVCIKIDPFRQTTANYYQEVMEFDHWYGFKFSTDLLNDTNVSGRTVHISPKLTGIGYEVKYTVFRTKMMDKSLREFIIEEYCPIDTRYNQKSPGVGKKYCVQKFAHVCYDQTYHYFCHLDGAVRIFNIGDYENYFTTIESGSDVSEKIGSRHKMFLVDGMLELDTVQELLAEWFRYNPHILEYFSGSKLGKRLTKKQ